MDANGDPDRAMGRPWAAPLASRQRRDRAQGVS
eukprot:CAMPEP_0179837910 /NCGR_PEP_ID=MMETSP0982-20121206/340_1 /TAXON_ID=483367 /ORGANISM="non described non described, Strain CCMP 2436" /LENGTH=32 /DNA_ID= /DNA_START= /DNA_END= /DNA_ORIENTATION=